MFWIVWLHKQIKTWGYFLKDTTDSGWHILSGSPFNLSFSPIFIWAQCSVESGGYILSAFIFYLFRCASISWFEVVSQWVSNWYFFQIFSKSSNTIYVTGASNASNASNANYASYANNQANQVWCMYISCQ